MHPDHIGGLYKVSQTDFSYMLYVSSESIKDWLMDLKINGVGKSQFAVTSLAEQTVKIKVHWLPLFYSDRLLKAIFCDYGDVIDINWSKSAYANICAYNGIREVLLRTDEVKKQKIPHLVKLSIGQSVLVTVQSRPPLCLKCNDLGHTRKDCPSSKKTYSTAGAAATARPGSSVSTVSVSEPTGAHVSPAGPGSAVPPTGAEPVPAPAPEGAPAGAGDAPQPQDFGSGGLDGSGDSPGTREPMEANDQVKRKSDGDEDDDFISPNRTFKQGPGPYPTPPLHLPLSQGYHALLGDLTPSTPTPK